MVVKKIVREGEGKWETLSKKKKRNVDQLWICNKRTAILHDSFPTVMDRSFVPLVIYIWIGKVVSNVLYCLLLLAFIFTPYLSVGFDIIFGKIVHRCLQQHAGFHFYTLFCTVVSAFMLPDMLEAVNMILDGIDISDYCVGAKDQKRIITFWGHRN